MDKDNWDRCCCCGCYLEIRGEWVGESHYDDFAIAICNNPRCRSNTDNEGTP